MDFNPRVLGEEDFFHQRYRLLIERYGDTASLKDPPALALILRRLKTDKSIIADLPEKLELAEWVELSGEQAKLYRKTVDDTLEAIQRAPLGQRHGQVLTAHQAQADLQPPRAAAGRRGGGPTAAVQLLQRLEEILEEVVEAGDRALLFTQFTSWGHLLKTHLQRCRRCRFCTGAAARTNAKRWWIVSRIRAACNCSCCR